MIPASDAFRISFDANAERDRIAAVTAKCFCEKDVSKKIEEAAEQGKYNITCSIPNGTTAAHMTDYLTQFGYRVHQTQPCTVMVKWSRDKVIGEKEAFDF